MYHNLYVARREKRLTQNDLADVLSINKQTYYLKESGKIDFKLKEALILSKYFKTTIDELFSR